MEKVYQLMTEKLAGIISAADEALLDELIEEDEQVRDLWEEIRLTPKPVNNKPWLDISSFAFNSTADEPEKVYRLPLQWVAAALFLIAGCIGAWMTWRHRSGRQAATTATTAAPVPAPAENYHLSNTQLQLADGRTIDLSTSQQAISIGSNQLHTRHKSLTYTASPDMPAGINRITVPIASDYKVTLSDGSVVWLNSASTLQFPFSFSSASREITIQGEAFITIAPLAGKPFIVHLPGSTIQVLGTSFNLNSYDKNHIRVSLVNGAVNMQLGRKTIPLKPGQQAVYKETSEAVTVRPFDADDELSWREGIYHFSNASLDELSKVIPRWFGVTVVIDNPKAANTIFSGRMSRDIPLMDLLLVLKETSAVDFYFSADSTLHFK
ncbi:FecR family protein [Chitinophaga sp. Mgbs1]|uniref:FecR family protein n=1 Tax=Chitinophaga solisilvae TaxID=1233460 RepID=A0A3S1BIX5_9BACT|nr:FecR family protein [Chitinophaga solisilvae]